MSKLRVRPQSATGVVIDITPKSAGWTYVGFRVLNLAVGESQSGGESGREACLVVLTGRCDIDVAGATFENIGGRTSVFDDQAPAAVYAPAGKRFTVTARTPVEVAICTAPGSGKGQARFIAPEQMSRETRGQGTNTRYVRNILPETEAAESLLLTEVTTPGGHWSSYPPHKHDTLTPEKESALEEIYYHRLDPPQGFAFQRIYTDDRSIDEAVAVEDGDVVLVPRGYHPVGAPHGYNLYYLNVMAGPQRTWIFNNDPAHDWIAKKK